MSRSRPIAVSVTAWAIGAVSSVTIGLVALRMIGTGVGDGPLQPLAPNALNQSAAAVAPDVVGPGGSPSGAPSASGSAGSSAGSVRTVNTVAGMAIVSCYGSNAHLDQWIPAIGYGADDISRGPGVVVKVTFENAQREVSITARCVGGVVEPTVVTNNSVRHDN